jgi:hypothetical protein
MSESVILCEGFHDRAFWDRWLTSLGCKSDGFKPGTRGFPALDPWGDPVRHGQFAYRSKSGKGFVRVRSCNGKSNVLKEARNRLTQRTTKRLLRLVINVDVDTSAAGMAPGPTGLRQQDVLHQVQQIDPPAYMNADGEIEVDGGATKVSLVRWKVNDPPSRGLPDQQTLERLACAALAAAYPARATSVQKWLDGRAIPIPPGANPKEHTWSYMAGWYAEHGCEAFYSNLWNDPQVVAELGARLRLSGAWQIAANLAT